MKIFCPCDNEITTMEGCVKKGKDYFCKKCGKKVTDKKIKQLIARIRENWVAIK